MKTKSIALLAGASAIALFLTACDSKQEQVREENLENKADAIDASATQLRKDGEKVADMKEENADAIRKNSEKAADATETNADGTRKAVEKRADQIEDQADKVREQK